MTNPLSFTIEGPDDDGFVWLKQDVAGTRMTGAWTRLNLGKEEDVIEVLSQWLASRDADERFG